MIAQTTAYWDIPAPVFEIADAERPAAGLTVQLVTDTASFAALESEWESLISESPATIFQTFPWQFLWWKHFGSRPENHLYILLFRLGEKLIGIAPFFIRTYAMFHFRVYRKLLLLGSGLGSPHSPVLSLEKQGPLDYLDIVSARGFEDQVADALIAILQNKDRMWDEIELQNIREDGAVLTHLLLKLKNQGFSISMQHEDTCPFIRLPDSVNKFLCSMRRSVRRNLRYVQRGFLENPEYSIEDAAAPKNTDGALQILALLHQKRWNDIGYPGLFADPRFNALLRDVSKSLAQKERLWFKVLRRDGKAVAVNFCFKFNGTMYTFASGFDRDSAVSGNSGAGSALVFQNIIDAIDSNFGVIDMGRGTESYKFQLTSNSCQNWRLNMKASGRPAEPLRIAFFRIYILGSRLLSRLTCEMSILKILINGKGTFGGSSAYVSHVAGRLFSKMKGPGGMKEEDSSASTGSGDNRDSETSSRSKPTGAAENDAPDNAAGTTGKH